MSSVGSILLSSLLGFAALFWIAAFVSTWRENRRARWVVKADTPLPVPPRLPRVSVVVPARNEARNLPSCLDAARALVWTDLEIVVLDDRSTDDTGRIARDASAADPRVRCLPGTELPAGWMGKCWALHQAVSAATGEWILFLDADVEVHPRALAQAHAYAVSAGAEMLSGYGFLRLETFWEKVVMPVLGGMIVGGNPLDQVNDPAHPRVVCNGQFILVSRAAYGRIGGHAAVRGEIIDDMALAREAKRVGVVYRMVFCRELFRTRMYTSLAEIWRGWRKNLFAALGYRPWVAIAVVAFVLWTAVLPPVLLVVGPFLRLPGPVVGAAAAATATLFGYRVFASRVFGQRWGLFWTHPLGALVVAGIFLESAMRGIAGSTVDWKGRSYGAGGPAV